MFRDSKDKPVWELMDIPKSSIETVDIICPNCQYHTAWRRGADWFNCCLCFDYVGNGADKRKAERVAFSQKLKIRNLST